MQYMAKDNFRIINKLLKLRLFGYLLRTKSKIRLITGLLKNYNMVNKNKNRHLIDSFIKFSESKNFDKNWVNNTKRFFTWTNIFLHKYDRHEPIKILEIGSQQGHSALFFLWFFKNANIDCIDVWGRYSKLGITQNRNEFLFDSNLKEFSQRLNKNNLFSLEFFAKKVTQRCLYDIIFIDGSHEAEDVLSDCLYSFALLKIYGLMIIDDVFHMSQKRFKDNSLTAIDCFLNLKGNDLRILKLNSQLFIEKIKDARIDSIKKLNY